MLASYALLIPRYGSMGAAIATLIGFMFLAAATWVVTQRVFPVQYEWSRLFALLLLAIGLWSLSRFLPAEPWTWPAKVGLWLLGPALVWFGGLMSPREKEHVRNLTGEARQRLLNCLTWSRAIRPRIPLRRVEEPATEPDPVLVLPNVLPESEQLAS
jgi:thiol:disulfide interchange protein